MPQQKGWVLVHQIRSSREAEVALKEIRYGLIECGKVFICFGDRGLIVEHDFGEVLGPGTRRVVDKLLDMEVLELEAVEHLDERGHKAMECIRSMVPATLLAELNRIGEPTSSTR